mgnify:CR=1 FL=1
MIRNMIRPRVGRFLLSKKTSPHSIAVTTPRLFSGAALVETALNDFHISYGTRALDCPWKLCLVAVILRISSGIAEMKSRYLSVAKIYVFA